MKTKTLASLIAGTVITAGTAIAITTPTSFKTNLAKGYLWDDTSSQSQPQPSESPSSDAASNSAAQPVDSTSQNSNPQAIDLSSEASTMATTETPAPVTIQSAPIEAQQPDPSANSPMIVADVQGINPSSFPTTDPQRIKILSTAMSQVGSVMAKKDDETGRRVGWQQLKQYFSLAAPGFVSDDVIEYRRHGKLPAWCGIFALWTLKTAGMQVGDWNEAVAARSGISSVTGIHTVSDPQPGDIAYIDQPYQHHAIVWKMEGNTVYTIDGNSGNFSEITAINKRSRSKISAFYSAF